MSDAYKGNESSGKSLDITPNDNTVLSPVPRALYIGTAGDLVVQLEDDGGATRTFKNAAAGYHPLRPVKVMAATAALQIVGLL